MNKNKIILKVKIFLKNNEMDKGRLLYAICIQDEAYLFLRYEKNE